MGKEEGGVEPAAKFAAVWDAGVVADRRRPPRRIRGGHRPPREQAFCQSHQRALITGACPWFSEDDAMDRKDYMVGFQEVLLHTDNVNLIMIKTSDVSSRNEMRSSPLPHRCLSE
ncbi:unnamed protein product [Spirodela intermedia]|uniref:Uncharacterized protein n=1 Tax=Spirodela intermedia TaxID=51605 RepID=A0A7I8IHK5_SPIIN|nr:unnamed protein product [Spirodela intermedia]CAA6656987.1 unnamed protein product [Spirodela intermedia]